MTGDPTIWTGCYRQQWGDLIVPEAAVHPAKFRPGLIDRIVNHGHAQGWWTKGDRIGDPFAGIGGGAIYCVYSGLRWVGVELEPKFVDLANQNFEHHAYKWSKLGYDRPQIVCGDSRQFSKLVGTCDAIVTSPPYAESLHANEAPEVQESRMRAKGQYEAIRKASRGGEFRSDSNAGYGHTPGQLGAMKPGKLDAVITSPPYEGIQGMKRDRGSEPGFRAEYRQGCSRGVHSCDTYGQTPGQIGQMKPGKLDAVITSPPYADSVKGEHGERETAQESRDARRTEGGSLGQSLRHGGYGGTEGQIGALPSGPLDAVITSPPYESSGIAGGGHQIDDTKWGTGENLSKANHVGYGESNGQLGNASGDTYWQAVADVYRECFKALKPGGVMAVVVKDYVKGGERVRLCDATLRLLGRCWFTLVQRIYAMIDEVETQPGLFGGEVSETKCRKSFFRQMAEAKGSPRIDYEEVLVVQKGAGG